MIFSSPDFDGHEAVHAFCDADVRLRGFIALHSTVLGPGFGGCRMWPYSDEAAAVQDALRLSRGMTYKNAMAELAYGGGKAVIIADPRHDKTPELMAAFGRVIERLGGLYITAEDVGVTVDDMRQVATQTRYVSGIPQEQGYRGGDPSPHTAKGIFEGLKAAAGVAFASDDLARRVVAIQGAGNVGYHLGKLLVEAGARLKVADISQANIDRAKTELGAEIVAPDEILTTDADILAPCALGGILSKETIPALNVKLVAGGANNQLETREDGQRLVDRGIVYAPDYVINAGGIISVSAERDPGATAEHVAARIARIGPRTREILEDAAKSGTPPQDVADARAREKIRSVRGPAA